jgi:predicted extracellular nuclease
MAQAYMSQAGLSSESIAALQNGQKLSKADANAIANQMTIQKANISLDETKNFKNMSKEGREAWTKAYAAEMSATAQTNQYQTNGNNSLAMFNALQEKNAIQEKSTLLQNEYNRLNAKGDSALTVLQQQLAPLKTELSQINNEEGTSKADIGRADRIIKKIKELQQSFCFKMTAQMIRFLNDAKDTTTAWLSDYDRFEVLQYQTMGLPIHFNEQFPGKGIVALQGVEAYVGFLKNVFQYKMYSN